MKRILCPKCDNYITFDETKYAEGQSLVFICEHCKKQFSIRIGKTKLKATRKEEVLDEQANSRDCGSIVVVENVFGYKQVHPLKEGDNVIGRIPEFDEVEPFAQPMLRELGIHRDKIPPEKEGSM